MAMKREQSFQQLQDSIDNDHIINSQNLQMISKDNDRYNIKRSLKVKNINDNKEFARIYKTRNDMLKANDENFKMNLVKKD